jgi:hypothetical protein
LQQENRGLRDRIDARELRPEYQPTLDTGKPPEPGKDQLSEYLLTGLEETERVAPTADTIVKITRRVEPLIARLVDQRIGQAETARQIDDEFWGGLADRWKKTDPKAPVALRKRYGRDVSDIIAATIKTPDGKLRSEYMNNHEAAFGKITEELEKRLQMVTEDAPVSSRPKPRAAGGDAGTARLPTSVPDAQRKEMTDLLDHATGR